MTDGYEAHVAEYIQRWTPVRLLTIATFDSRMWRKQRVDTALRGRIIRRVLAPPIRYREIGRLRRG